MGKVLYLEDHRPRRHLIEDHKGPRHTVYGTKGSLISGTLSWTLLLPAFRHELERLCKPSCAQRHAHQRLLRCTHTVYLASAPLVDWEDACISLRDALCDHASPGDYFGSRYDNEADFGFWPISDLVD